MATASTTKAHGHVSHDTPAAVQADQRAATSVARGSGPWWYHNTSRAAWEQIQREGMDAGTFSSAPIDFGGEVWIKVRQGDIPRDDRPALHQYGRVTALEPAWEDRLSKTRQRIAPEAILFHREKRQKST